MIELVFSPYLTSLIISNNYKNKMDSSMKTKNVAELINSKPLISTWFNRLFKQFDICCKQRGGWGGGIPPSYNPRGGEVSPPHTEPFLPPLIILLDILFFSQ